MADIHHTLRNALSTPFAFAFTIYFLQSFATQLLEVPTLRLIESAVCAQYYRSHESGTQSRDQSPATSNGVDEQQCKIAEIQDTLANIMGWKLSFDALPGLLTALLYGSVADKYGRRLVVVLALLGTILMLLGVVVVCTFNAVFPIGMVLATSTFLLLGGGQRVFCSMIYTLVSDSLEHSQRTKYLYLLAAGPHINRLLTPPIAAALMRLGVLLPFLVSLPLLGACFFASIVISLPETQSQVQHDLTLVDSIEEEPLVEREPDSGQQSTPLRIGGFNKTQKSDSIQGRLPAHLSLIQEQIMDLFRTPASRYCLVAFFFKRVSFTSEAFVFQYASEKFHWLLWQTTWLRVAAAFGAIFATLIFWPIVSSVLPRRGCAVPTLDLNAVRSSLLIAVVAFFSAWRANSGTMLMIVMVGCGLGEGIEPALQGLVTFLSDGSHNAQLFTTIAMVDTVGELTGGPFTAQLMAVGRRPGHPSEGLCFLASAIMFAFLGVWACFVRAER